jgi:cytochrome c-type biogenesis protein CcmH/NrfG
MAGVALTLVLAPLGRERVAHGPGLWVLVGVALALSTFAFAVYLALGRPDAGMAAGGVSSAPAAPSLRDIAALRAPEALGGPRPPAARAAPVASLVAGLERRLREHPGDAGGWLLLARSYEHLGRLDEARAAYRQAVVLGAGDPELATSLRTSAADTGAGAEAREPGRERVAPAGAAVASAPGE